MFSSQGGQTALHRASSSGHTGVVELLVDSGAQLDHKNRVSTEPSMVLCCDSYFIMLYSSYCLSLLI